ncbi:MAG: hypothetical protein EZS28_005202 [Streblomastix strix]|uniref:Protein kinase domain-containing protein n=1 Tax=Streblomastix strix TaxID=222440 RepID=A0A5J4WW84_9EUKA|nr:MAG: hypothetical protein EZS28_005202 [Streblomastix strix]
MYEVDILPKIGDNIKDRYKIVLKISQGEKRMIFCAIDQQMQQIAVKLEQDTDGQTTICIESAILKILANSNHIPRFFSYGQHKNCKFMAYELLGPNLIDLVNYKEPYKFSLHSVLKFGIQAIETLQIVHNKDFIHRNIKPGSFLIGNTQETFGTFYLIDFELCKKINKHHGVVTTPTNKANFRGTMMYASLNAHNLVELGRQDDLISLLYILVEFYNGMLPWSDVDELSSIQQTNTLHEFIEVLDALTGIKSDDDFNPFENNIQYESQSSIRLENYVEQFIDGMKKKDDKYKQLDWASFVEQTGGSHHKEGFDGIDISESEQYFFQQCKH